MPLPIGSTLGIFADNIRKRKSVLPLGAAKVTAWARGLNIPAGGETVLYTGQMYQLMPSINSMSRQLAGIENSWIANFFGFGRMANKVINLSAFMAHAGAAEQAAYNRPLQNIARLLNAAGIKFGYLYQHDLYAGALAYDEGLDDAFAAHAAMIHEMLKAAGVKELITVDPHTTNILRSIYPRVIKGFDIRVKSYLEVLAECKMDSVRSIDEEVTIHDSCIYARHEDVVDQPRVLLKNGGVKIIEAELSSKLTNCCGGPLESLFPGKAAEIARRRLDQLSGCAQRIITLCPICLANLQHFAPPDISVGDISDYLAQAYCPADRVSAKKSARCRIGM
jgi:Fe-S oxidoreductase